MEVFYGGTSLELLIFYHCLWSHQQNILFLMTYIFNSIELFVITIIHNYVEFTTKDTNLMWCDPSVCSRSWGPVPSVPTYYQLAPLVLLPAFLWSTSSEVHEAWSHHLCGVFYREQPRQPGKPAQDCNDGTKVVKSKPFRNFNIHIFKC